MSHCYLPVDYHLLMFLYCHGLMLHILCYECTLHTLINAPAAALLHERAKRASYLEITKHDFRLWARDRDSDHTLWELLMKFRTPTFGRKTSVDVDNGKNRFSRIKKATI